MDAATFVFSSLPQNMIFTAGSSQDIIFTVKNTSTVDGEATISFRAADLVNQTTSVLIGHGEEKEVHFTLDIPSDYPTGDYMGVVTLQGAEVDVPFSISGMKVTATAQLDKEAYQIGENAVVTLNLENQSQISPLAVFVRVQFNGFDEKKSIALNSPGTVEFTVPVTEGPDSKLFYGVYQEDGGRSLVLNDLYIPLKGQAVTLTTDKQVYNIGDTVTVTANVSEAGNFKAQYFGQDSELTFDAEGRQTFSFTVPPVAAGTYTVFYDFGKADGTTVGGSLNFDVAGYQVRVTEALLDKSAYKPQDTVKVTLRFESNTAFSGKIQGFLFDPDGDSIQIFEESKNVVAGLNRYDKSFSLNALHTGLYRFVYGILVEDPQILLMSGTKAFEVEGVSLLSLTTNQEEYKDTEEVSANLTTFGNMKGTLVFYIDAQPVATEERIFSGIEESSKNLGAIAPGLHTLQADILSTVTSTKTVDFSVKDITPPTRIVDLQANIANDVQVQLTWSGTQDNVGVVRYKVLRLQNEPITDANKLLATILTNTLPSNTRTYVDTAPEEGKTFYYAVTAFDAVGNQSLISNSPSVTVPMVPPVISGLVPADGAIINNTTPTITAIITDKGKGVDPQKAVVVIDGAALSSSYDLTTEMLTAVVPSFRTLKEGIHTLKITALDKAGNSTVSETHFIVDLTGPIISITTPQNGSFVNTKEIVVRAQLADNFSGVNASTIVLKADGVTYPYSYDSDTSILTYAWTSSITDGLHEVTIDAKDNVGNLAVQGKATFTLDTIKPQIQNISDAPDPFSPGNSAGVKDETTITAAIDDVNFDRWKITVKDAQDTPVKEFTGTTDAVETIWNGTKEDGATVEDGLYRYIVSATDKAKNEATSPENLITVDKTNPVSTLTSSVSLFNNQYAPASTMYSVAADDPVVGNVNSGIEKIEVAKDNDAFTIYTTAVSLDEGKHTLRHKATDNAGNTEEEKTFNVDVDGTSPATTLSPSAPLFNSVYAPLATTYSLSAVDPVSQEVASGVMKTVFKIDGGAETQYSSAISLTDGEHTIAYFSKDNVLNIETEKTFTVKVDNTPPASSLQPSASLYANQYAPAATTYTFSAIDTTSYGVASGVSKIEYTLDGGETNIYNGNPITLTEGIHTFAFYATDNVGNAEQQKTYVVNVDNTAPITTISAGIPKYQSPDKLYISITTSITLTSDDPVVLDVSSDVLKREYKIDNRSFATYTTAFKLTEGVHTVTFRSTDNVGNVEQEKLQVFYVDKTASVTTLSPAPTTFTNTASYTLSATDPVNVGVSSGVKEIRYKIDNGPEQIYAGNPIALADGLHTIEYFSVDNVENIESHRTVSFTVDTVLPQVVNVSDTPDPFSPGASFGVKDTNTIAASINDTNPSTWQIQLYDAANASVKVLSGTGSSISQIWDGRNTQGFFVNDGVFSYNIIATDKAGNKNKEASSTDYDGTISVDKTSPISTVTPSVPLFASAYAPLSTTYSVSSDDPMVNSVNSGVDKIEATRDTDSLQPYVSALSFTTEGSHSIQYRATDKVGNTESTKSFVVAVDNTPPTTTFSTSPSLYQNIYASSSTSVLLLAVDPTSNSVSSGVSKTMVKLDEGAFLPYPQSLSFTEGVHTLTFFSVDNVGNTEQEKTKTINVDTTAPVTQFVPSQPLFNGIYAPTTTTYTFTATDPLNLGVSSGVSSIFYSIDNGVLRTFTGQPVALSSGVHTFTYYSKDNVGNTENAKTVTVYVDSVAPITSLSVGTPLFFDQGKAYVSGVTPVTLTATDPLFFGVASGVLLTEYNIDGGSFATYSSAITLNEGVQTLNYRSVDNVGNTETQKSQVFNVDTTPPVVQVSVGEPKVIASGKTIVGATTLFTLTASDSVSGGVSTGIKELRYRINSGAWQVFSAPTTSFNLSGFSQGEINIEFQSTDKVENTSAIQSLTVTLDTAPPVISNVVPADKAFVDRVQPIISADVLDDGSGLNPQKVFVKVGEALLDALYDTTAQKVTAAPSFNLTEGTHTLKVTAFDIAGNQTTSQTVFTVDVTAPSVTLQTPSNGSFTNSTNITVQAQLSDALSGVDANSLILKTDGITAFFTYDASTGALTYIWPAGMTDGVHEITMDAKDTAGNTAAQVRSIFTLDTLVPQVTHILDAPDPISPANSFGVKDTTTITAQVLDANADAWTLNLLDRENNTLKATSGSGNDISVLWNGTDANGAPVQDGVYNYILAAKDKARNVSEGSTLQKTTVLEDSFDSPNIDTGKWTVTNDDAGLTVTQSNGTLTISGQPTQGGGSPIGNGVASKLFADSGSNFTLEFDADMSASQVNSGASVSANILAGNLSTGSAALLQYFYHSATVYELRFLGQSIPVASASGHIALTYNASAKTMSLSFNGEKKVDLPFTLTSGVFSFLAAGGATTDVVNVSYDNFSLTQETLTALQVAGTVTVDNTSPVSQIELLGEQYASGGGNGPADVFVSGATQVAVVAEDPTVNNVASGIEKTEVALDAGDFGNYVTPFTLQEGRHTVRHSAQDFAGNTSQQQQMDLNVDATAPVTTLSPAPKPFTSISRYSLSVNDPESFGVSSGVRETRYRVDGAEYLYNGSPITLSDGYHTIEFFSVDNVENEEHHQFVSFTVDTTKPEVTNISDMPDPFSPGNSPSVKATNTITASVNDANPDTWQIALFDSANNPVQTFNGSGSFITQLWNGSLSSGGIVPDGLYSYSILATDRAGNTNKESSGGSTTTKILLQDDFNGPTLDTTKWTVNPFPNADGGLQVTQENGELRIFGTSTSENPGDKVTGVLSNVQGDATKKLNLSVDVDVSHSQVSASEGKAVFSLVLLGNFSADALITLYIAFDQGNYQLFYQTFSGQFGDFGAVPPQGKIGLAYDPSTSKMTLSFNGEVKGDIPFHITDTAFSALATTANLNTFADVRFDNFLFTEEGSSNGGGSSVQVSDNFDDGQIDTNTWDIQTLRPNQQYALEEKEGQLVFSGVAQYNDPEFVRAKQALNSTEDFSVSVFVDLTQSELGQANSGATPEAVPLAALALGNEFKIYATVLTQQPAKTYRLYVFSQEAGFITLGDVSSGAGQFLINYNAQTKALDVYFNGNKQTTLQTTWAQEQIYVLLGAAGYVGDTVVVKFDNFSVTQGESGGGNGTPSIPDGYVTVDNTSPTTALEIAGVAFTQNNETFVSGVTQLTVHSNDPVVNGVSSGVEATEYAVDDTAFQPYSMSFTLPEGARNVHHKATDTAGNFSEQQTQLHVDTTAPVTTLSPMPEGFTNVFDYSLSATDPVSNNVASGIKELHYTVDGTEQITTGDVPLHFSGGAHTLEYFSVDNVNNTEQKHSLSFMVDNIPPVVKDVSDAPDPFSPGVSSGVKDTNIISALLEDMSDVTWQIGLFDASNANIQTFNGNGKTIQQVWDGKDTQGNFVSDGLYAYSISAMDAGGNRNKEVSATTVDGSVVVDKTNPVSTLTPSVALFNNQYAATSVTYGVAADDPVINSVNSGVEKIEVSKDTEAFTTYTSAVSLDEGKHTLRHKATDNAGNTEEEKTFNVDVDGTSPATTLSPSAPLFNSVYAPLATTYSLSATDPVLHDVSSGVLKTVYKIDSGEETQYAQSFSLTEGEHIVTYFSKDNVLNFEQEKTQTIKVDNTAPVTQVTPSAPLFADKYAPTSTTYTFASSDPTVLGVSSGVMKIEYTVDGGVTNTYTGQPISLTEGIHTFTFFATDNVGNAELQKTFTVHVDNTSPMAKLSVGTPQCSDNGKVIVSAQTPFNLTASDPESNNVSSGVKEIQYRVNGGAWQTFTGSFTLTQNEGDVVIDFQAVDNVNNTQIVQSLTVTLDKTAPSIAILSPQDKSVINNTIAVMGTVTDTHFTNGSYTVSFGSGQNPASFTTINTGTAQNDCTAQNASCDPLTTWSAGTLTQNTLYTLKLSANDCVGNSATTQVLLRVGDPEFALSFGERGSHDSNEDEFKEPVGVAAFTADDNVEHVLTADKQSHQVKVFDGSGNYLTLFGDDPQNKLNKPTEVATDTAKNIYVVDSQNDRVVKFDKNYIFQTAFTSLNRPYGITLDIHGNLYITDAGNNRVVKLDANGNLLTQWTSVKQIVNTQEQITVFSSPAGVAVDTQENVYVADSGSNRIFKFSQDGTLLRVYDASGATQAPIPNGSTSLSQPMGLTLDSFGNLYVADSQNNRIQKFDPWGNRLLNFGTQGAGNNPPEGTFHETSDMALDTTSKFMYVSDVKNHRVQKFAIVVDAPPVVAKLAPAKNENKDTVIADPNLLNVLKVVPYPTPSRGKLSFNLEAEGNVTQITLEVYTITGKRVLTDYLPVATAPGAKGKGKFKAESPSLDAVLSSLPNGVYVYRLQISNGVKTVNKTGKFVVVK